jgi:hypothetical protein
MEVAFVVSRMLAGAYFVWAGSAKLGRTQTFWSEIMGYRMVGPRAAGVLASVIIPVEFICGLFFAAGVSPVLTGSGLLVLVVLFTLAISISLVRKMGNDCGCGAGVGKVRPVLVVRNAVVAVLVVAGMLSPAPAYPGELIVLAMGTLAGLVIAVGSHRQLMH